MAPRLLDPDSSRARLALRCSVCLAFERRQRSGARSVHTTVHAVEVSKSTCRSAGVLKTPCFCPLSRGGLPPPHPRPPPGRCPPPRSGWGGGRGVRGRSPSPRGRALWAPPRRFGARGPEGLARTGAGQKLIPLASRVAGFRGTGRGGPLVGPRVGPRPSRELLRSLLGPPPPLLLPLSRPWIIHLLILVYLRTRGLGYFRGSSRLEFKTVAVRSLNPCISLCCCSSEAPNSC